MKKVIFMGTPEFSTGVLKRLIEDDTVEVIAVVTQPDRAVGRKKIITPTPVKVVALEHDISVYQPEKLSGSQELEELMQLDADLIVTAAYGQFLPTKFLNFPRFGAVNVHASLLPKISWWSSNPLCNYERGQRNWRNNYANGCKNGCGCDYFTTRHSNYW